MISKYEKLLSEKDNELKEYIQKYNDAKVELMDQLDGKSDMMHNVEADLQNTINILKEQVEAQESESR